MHYIHKKKKKCTENVSQINEVHSVRLKSDLYLNGKTITRVTNNLWSRFTFVCKSLKSSENNRGGERVGSICGKE